MDTYMDFLSFEDRLRGNLQAALEGKAAVERVEVPNADGIREAIAVRLPGSPFSPVIYPEEEYEKYLSGRTVEELTEELTRRAEPGSALNPATPDFTESVRNHLYCAVINAEENRELLSVVPHEQVEDLAVVARCGIAGKGSVLVDQNFCAAMRMTGEEALEAAHANTERNGFELCTVSQMIQSLLSGYGEVPDMDETYADDVLAPSPDLYVLTNRARCEGAGVITSRTALRTAYERMGEYYILPSSRHEVLLLPKSAGIPAEELRTMVREINASDVINREDKLSDSVYEYDPRRQRIALVSEKRTEAEEKTSFRAHAHGMSH